MPVFFACDWTQKVVGWVAQDKAEVTYRISGDHCNLLEVLEDGAHGERLGLEDCLLTVLRQLRIVLV